MQLFLLGVAPKRTQAKETKLDFNERLNSLVHIASLKLVDSNKNRGCYMNSDNPITNRSYNNVLKLIAEPSEKIYISWKNNEPAPCKRTSYGVWNCGGRTFKTYPYFGNVLDNSGNWWKIRWKEKKSANVSCKKITPTEFIETSNVVFEGYIDSNLNKDYRNHPLAEKYIQTIRKYELIRPDF